MQRVYSDFGLPYSVGLSTRPAGSGTVETWDHAEASLKEALERTGHAYSIDAGDGAFYGPKIDVDVTDAIGRKWQCATFQLDYQMPERFDLKYTGADNTEHRPVVIHRAIFGTFERFIGVLIEHYAGAGPSVGAGAGVVMPMPTGNWRMRVPCGTSWPAGFQVNSTIASRRLAKIRGAVAEGP
jgi:threonyl-tRNA synthetase